MSMADLAAALIGLRESNVRETARLTAALEALSGQVEASREGLVSTVDGRLATAAQGVLDLDRRLAAEYERRYEAVLGVILEVAERLGQLVETAESTDDPAELSARLASLAGPRDRLTRILNEAGIHAFNSAGEPYDPLRHEVVSREFADDLTHEYVATELRPGYVREGLDHTMVRAQVIVASPRPTEGNSHG